MAKEDPPPEWLLTTPKCGHAATGPARRPRHLFRAFDTDFAILGIVREDGRFNDANQGPRRSLVRRTPCRKYVKGLGNDGNVFEMEDSPRPVGRRPSDKLP
ncbi:hypothetical protein KM043_004544 [Ampulex compressa]|nr:hypothetical protein KM043_004544 [Ampulex compressa]